MAGVVGDGNGEEETRKACLPEWVFMCEFAVERHVTREADPVARGSKCRRGKQAVDGIVK